MNGPRVRDCLSGATSVATPEGEALNTILSWVGSSCWR